MKNAIIQEEKKLSSKVEQRIFFHDVHVVAKVSDPRLKKLNTCKIKSHYSNSMQ